MPDQKKYATIFQIHEPVFNRLAELIINQGATGDEESRPDAGRNRK